MSPEPTSRYSDALIGGDVDTDDSGAVLVMIKKVNFSKPFAWCTGTVVSPHVIVTAAHCVSVTPADVPADAKLSVFVGSAYDYGNPPATNDLFYDIAETHAFPGYTDATQQSQGRDIAVIITSEALPVTPYPMIDSTLDASLEGQTVRLVGAGANVLPSTMMYSTGTRKTLTLPITALDDRFIHEAGSAGASCEGDSGGPTLLSRDGVDYVIGIHAASVGIPECTGANYDTRIDLYTQSFITPFVNQADPGFLTTGSGGSVSAGGGEPAATKPPSTTKDKDNAGCSVVPSTEDSWAPWILVGAAIGASRRRSKRLPLEVVYSK